MSNLVREARQYRTDGAYRIVHKLADEIERLEKQWADEFALRGRETSELHREIADLTAENRWLFDQLNEFGYTISREDVARQVSTLDSQESPHDLDDIRRMMEESEQEDKDDD